MPCTDKEENSTHTVYPHLQCCHLPAAGAFDSLMFLIYVYVPYNSCAGSGVVRIDPLRFLAGCCKR